MEHDVLLRRAIERVARAGYPRVRKLGLFNDRSFLSYCFPSKGEIFLGMWARALDSLGIRDAEKTVVHEIGHVLVRRYPPPVSVKKVFGSLELWETYSWKRLFTVRSTACTAYGKTGPEENMVEAFRLHVFGELGEGAELSALEQWQMAMRRKWE